MNTVFLLGYCFGVTCYKLLTASVCDQTLFPVSALFRMNVRHRLCASQETISQFDQIPAASCLPESHWYTNPCFVHSVMGMLWKEGCFCLLIIHFHYYYTIITIFSLLAHMWDCFVLYWFLMLCFWILLN